MWPFLSWVRDSLMRCWELSLHLHTCCVYRQLLVQERPSSSVSLILPHHMARCIIFAHIKLLKNISVLQPFAFTLSLSVTHLADQQIFIEHLLCVSGTLLDVGKMAVNRPGRNLAFQWVKMCAVQDMLGAVEPCESTGICIYVALYDCQRADTNNHTCLLQTNTVKVLKY